mgnify:CR=1 FL=1
MSIIVHKEDKIHGYIIICSKTNRTQLVTEEINVGGAIREMLYSEECSPKDLKVYALFPCTALAKITIT